MTTDKTLTFGFVPHSFDGSSYYWVWLPCRHFQEESHHRVFVCSPGTADISYEQAHEFEAISFQRPAGRDGAKMLEQLVGHTKLVYEIDDDMLNATTAGIPHLVSRQLRDSVKRCLRLCDMVTTTNEYLAEIVAPYNDNIRILPNHIKAGVLDIVRPRRDKLVIGWAGGTSHLGDMVTVEVPLRNILDKHPEVEMHFMGTDLSPLTKHECRFTPWNKDVGDYYKAVDFDIAIAPSEDTVFNRSKTWIRALEMGGLGIPIVAQNRLPYSDYVIDGVTGFLVDTEQQWEDRLQELINDPDLRETMGAAARVQASKWTIETGWKLWEEAFEHAAEG
jgi:glycosyltransferase involved in cell wall biosynthesis